MFLLSGIAEFNIFGATIPLYGPFGILAFLLGMLLCLITAGAFGLRKGDAAYIYLFGSIGALLFSKLFYLLVSINRIVADISAHGFKVLTDVYLTHGMSFYGGVLGAILGVIITCRIFGLHASDSFNCLVPAFILSHSVFNIEAFLSGFGFGNPTHSNFSVIYKSSAYAPNGEQLIPVQLIESAFELLLAAVLLITALAVTKKASGRSVIRATHPGWYTSVQTGNKNGFLVLGLYFLLYGCFRFALGFFRGDAACIFLMFSVTQWLSIAAVISGIILILFSHIDNRI
ncbi:MAG: prolipoprotein diacylglyceryl transferase [Clostridia bacterium]|nr:prolipoprotein diacylglyceryl transferase [Clostridia bacterium]